MYRNDYKHDGTPMTCLRWAQTMIGMGNVKKSQKIIFSVSQDFGVWKSFL